MVIAEVSEMVKRIATPYLGQYLIGNNPPIDAFAVVPPEPRQGWGVRGLELVIQSTPQLVDKSMFGSARYRKQLWTMFLIQHDRSNVDTLTAARDELLKRIPLSYQIYQPQTEVKMERCTVRFESFVYVKQK
jgi:hypothetical protein